MTGGLDQKALENIEAAERLLPDDEGRDALPNAAASRAYYAVYLAVSHRAASWGYGFTDRARSYYRHDRLPEDAVAWGILDPQLAGGLRLLYDFRIRADYGTEDVTLEEASDAFDIARNLIATVLKVH
jgi:uncharacterized protein (UPF0332 family)